MLQLKEKNRLILNTKTLSAYRKNCKVLKQTLWGQNADIFNATDDGTYSYQRVVNGL